MAKFFSSLREGIKSHLNFIAGITVGAIITVFFLTLGFRIGSVSVGPFEFDLFSEVEVTRVVEVTRIVEVPREGETSGDTEGLKNDETNDVQPISYPEETICEGLVEFSATEPSSNKDGATLTLTDVELLPNTNMRLHVAIWNKNNEDWTIGFYRPDTFLVDEHGNKYSLIDTNSPDGRGLPLESGVKVEYWFDFASPIDQAQNFNVRLARPGTGSWYLQFGDFSMVLEEPC